MCRPCTHGVRAAAAGPAWYPPLAPTGAQQADAPTEQVVPFAPLPPVAAASAPSPAAEADAPGAPGINSPREQQHDSRGSLWRHLGAARPSRMPRRIWAGAAAAASAAMGSRRALRPLSRCGRCCRRMVQASSSLSSASSSDPSSMAPTKQGGRRPPKAPTRVLLLHAL